MSDFKKFEKNNKSIALNVLFVPYNLEQIRPGYVLKFNSNRENQIILLEITDGKKSYYLAIKKLPALLRGITSNHNGDFYCLICFHCFRTKNMFKKHENVCKDHDCCYVEIPNKDNHLLKYNHGKKSMKAPFIIYADTEPLLEEISTCHINPNQLSTPKINKHLPPGYSLFTHCWFDNTKNRRDCYRCQDYMKMFCKDLKEHAKSHKNLIRIKKFAIYLRKDLDLMITVKSEIIVILLENIEEPLIMPAILNIKCQKKFQLLFIKAQL